MFDRSRIRFHDKNWQKSGARFLCAVSKVVDRVKRSNTTLFIYKPQTRVWFVYVLPNMFLAVLYKEK
jgi:hypothetical protein